MKSDIIKSFTHLGKEIDVILRHHPTAKKMRLRIDTKTQKAIVIMPKYCSQKKALEFAVANASWLLGKLKNTEPKIIIKNNAKINILGQEVVVKHQNKLRGITEIVNNELQVYGETEALKKRVSEFIKDKVKNRANLIIEKYSQKLGVICTGLKIKDTTSRWGSCNSMGEISICWRLGFAPLPILDYIIIHEVTHLKHFDHSPHFWHTVEKFFPEYEKAQKWLTSNQLILQNIG